MFPACSHQTSRVCAKEYLRIRMWCRGASTFSHLRLESVIMSKEHRRGFKEFFQDSTSGPEFGTVWSLMTVETQIIPNQTVPLTANRANRNMSLAPFTTGPEENVLKEDSCCNNSSKWVIDLSCLRCKDFKVEEALPPFQSHNKFASRCVMEPVFKIGIREIVMKSFMVGILFSAKTLRCMVTVCKGMCTHTHTHTHTHKHSLMVAVCYNPWDYILSSLDSCWNWKQLILLIF